MKVLLVEDTVQLNKALTTLLKRNSFVVDSAFDGEEALSCIQQYQYDAIVLDIMMPKVDGLEVLRRVRKDGVQTPIILLTAKGTIEDKITGLDLGADDYLPKPFNAEELLARIRALGRRKAQEFHPNEDVSFGDIALDMAAFTVACGENKATLSNKEAQVLSLLLAAKGKVVSVEAITNQAWDMDASAIDANVWVYISYLRKKLSSIGAKTTIKSIRYQGYYLECKND